MLGGMKVQVNETMQLLVSQKGCWRNIAIALIDRAEFEELAINSPSKLGNLEGLFGSFECGKARWGKGFMSLTSKLTGQRSTLAHF